MRPRPVRPSGVPRNVFHQHVSGHERPTWLRRLPPLSATERQLIGLNCRSWRTLMARQRRRRPVMPTIHAEPTIVHSRPTRVHVLSPVVHLRFARRFNWARTGRTLSPLPGLPLRPAPSPGTRPHRRASPQSLRSARRGPRAPNSPTRRSGTSSGQRRSTERAQRIWTSRDEPSRRFPPPNGVAESAGSDLFGSIGTQSVANSRRLADAPRPGSSTARQPEWSRVEPRGILMCRYIRWRRGSGHRRGAARSQIPDDKRR